MSQQKNVKQSVAAVVVTADDRVLLIKRRDVPIWVLPGGGVDNNESPEEAVVREVWEETGVSVSIVRQVAVYTPINRLTNITHLFECTPISGELRTGNETRQLGYFNVNSMPQPFFYIHSDWIADVQKKQSSIIRKPLSQITYFQLIKYFCRQPIQVIRFLLSRFGFPINS